MSDSPAGTPQADPAQSPAQSATAAADGSEQVTVNKQFKDEALKWKQKAEDYNKLEAQLEAERQRLAQLERIAYGGGRQATDTRAELISQLGEQAQYDPASKAALWALQEAEVAKAELWLKDATESITSPAKREQVRALVRSQNFQMSVDQALNMVSDPESKTLAEQLAAMKDELERLKGAKPNGVSPASVTPASASKGDDNPTEMKWSEYTAALRAGGENAVRLKKSVGSGEVRLLKDQ